VSIQDRGEIRENKQGNELVCLRHRSEVRLGQGKSGVEGKEAAWRDKCKASYVEGLERSLKVWVLF
jgi:hypothetical protein